MKRLSALTALLAALTALTMSAAAAASPGAQAAYRCGKVDIGFTNAAVRAKRTACPKARGLIRLWLRRVDDSNCTEGNQFCRVVRVRKFRCVRGGTEVTIELKCRRARQRVSAVWGD